MDVLDFSSLDDIVEMLLHAKSSRQISEPYPPTLCLFPLGHQHLRNPPAPNHPLSPPLTALSPDRLLPQVTDPPLMQNEGGGLAFVHCQVPRLGPSGMK